MRTARTARTARGQDWSGDAACLDEDPELFVPVGSSRPAEMQTDEARAVCAGCAVRTACLKSALESNIPYGVSAGTTPEDRARLKRRGEIVARSA